MPNLAEQRRQLEEILREAERTSPPPSPAAFCPAPESRFVSHPPMAIIGLAGRFPKADTIDAFWANLIAKRNCIQALKGARAEEFARLGGEPQGNGFASIKHFGLLEDIYRFDAPFFQISRREAEVMDPHMRLLLEAAWSCIENAGYRPRSMDRRTGIFISFYNYEYSSLLGELEVDASSQAYLATATTGAIFANRISYLLGLNGPSEVYNTACSTALVALHRAVQAIAAGDCRQAIVAGVSLLLTPGRVAALSGLGILNPTGVCNPYSHPANGEVIGEGVGAVMIKPLAQAEKDRDYIYAVIRGTDVNHQGDRSGRMTLPAPEALAELLSATYAKLGVDPENLCYVEGHGAGGEADVIELRALQRFLENAGRKYGKVPIGSVKGNIGFGEASGGIAQLAKCALAFHHGQIPATLHFERVDPVFDLDHSLLAILSENTPLETAEAEACVSILAYGLGGTNAHVMLSGHQPSPREPLEAGPPPPLLFSAGSKEVLAEYLRQLAVHLQTPSHLSRYRAIYGTDSSLLRGVAETLAARERQASDRVAFLVDSLQAFQDCCADYLSGIPSPRIIQPGASFSPVAPGSIQEAARRWVAGDNGVCAAWFEPGAYRKLPLPAVPFRGEEHRLQPRAKPSPAGKLSLEDRWTTTRSETGTVIEISLTSRDCFMAEHRVEGVAVMPAAGYVALLARIMRRIYHEPSCVIENLAWTLPFEMGEGSATLRFEISESGAFRIRHKEQDHLCCKGRLRLRENAAPAEYEPRINAARLAGLSPVVDGPRYWALANAPETRQVHGAPLRRLTAIYAVDGDIIGVLDSLEEASCLSEIALLDSAFGTCRGFSLSDSSAPQAVVPFAVERIDFLRPFPGSQKVYTSVRERRDTLGRYDISMEDGAGRVYAVIRGYYPKPFTRLARPPAGIEKSPGRVPVKPAPAVPLEDILLSELRRRVAGFLKCDPAAVPLEGSLAPLGLDSIGINVLTDQISQRMNFDLPATAFFEYASLGELVEYLVGEFPAEMEAFARDAARGEIQMAPVLSQSQAEITPVQEKKPHRRVEGPADIAVIGMGGLFPGAGNIRALWEKLRAGRDLVTEMPEPRRRSVYRLYSRQVQELKGLYGGFIEEADKFDAAFFGFSQDEVMAMDPQQRLFLEAAWAALEDAGYYPLSLSGRKVGVYVGAIVNDYGAYLGDVGYPVSMFHEGTGSSLAGIANRVSYALNLTGPSQAVDAACCSSLYAVDRAVSDLLSGACSAALAGGVSFISTVSGFQMYAAMNYLAKDWRCKAFAEGGDGWSKAELFAAVFLKRYEDAIRDKDPIYAVIKASGTNHGGKGYFYTQPNSARHAELIREVYGKAGIDPRSIVHIEAHGSGTGMGDALEFNTISRALKEFAAEQGLRLPDHSCGLGSIKSNFGHAEAGAGIAGFIKTVLLLHHRSLPPTLHLSAINRQIRLKSSPLYLVEEEKIFAEEKAGLPSAPRCAGVHSFNFSGAAAHALLAQHIAAPQKGSLGLTRFPVCLSAKTTRALTACCRELAQFLRETRGGPGWLDQLACTINKSRSFFPCRRGFIVESVEDLAAQLEAASTLDDANTAIFPAGQAPAAKADYPSLCDEQVELLVRRWLGEADFNWMVVLAPFSVEGLHLPTYPFEHDRSYFPAAGEAAGLPTGQPESVFGKVEQVSSLCPNGPILSGGQDVCPTFQTRSETRPAVGRSISREAPAEPGQSSPAVMVEEQLKEILGRILSLSPQSVDLDRGVGEYGFDSLKIIALSDSLNRQFGLRTMPPDLFEFSTPRQMAEFVTAARRAQPQVMATGRGGDSLSPQGSIPTAQRGDEPSPSLCLSPMLRIGSVAIVGVSGQFPGAADLDEFWDNLVAGKDAITEIPPDRWDWKSVYGDPRREPGKTKVRWGGFIDDVTVFDPLFFRISPREAEAMDPQQRLLMMYVWRVIEDAGWRPSSLAGTRTGLFIATGSTNYGAGRALQTDSMDDFGSTGSIPSIGPNRMSHFLDLRGPSEPVETSCSSSLVAIHRAVLAIQAGECEMAIAGGINTIVTPEDHIGFSKAGMLCEDGRCKTFSGRADGYGRGEGVGMLLLKPLAAAEACGDHIYGIIRRSAVNHGGRSNSLTAPNPKAQAELLQTAYAKAGIDPRTVGYIEAHGTGTPLGDPIEINGLKMAFQALYQAAEAPPLPEPHCALASVKTNIGHLELAAGVAGVIKVLLQLRHQTLIKGLHGEPVNPYIQLEGSPFYLLRENRPWPQIPGPDGRPLPRRAGVSSFGFGGVNAHVVIEEYVPSAVDRPTVAESAGPRLVVLSAKNEARLHQMVQNLRRFLTQRPPASLSDLAYTLQIGREEMEVRLAIQAESIEDLITKLQNIEQGRNSLPEVARGSVSGIENPAMPSTAMLQPNSSIRWSDLAKHWVQGGAVDWSKLYDQPVPRRISLPAYPFARERCWTTVVSSPVAVPESESDEIVFIPRWQEDGPWLSSWQGRLPRTILLVHSGPEAGLPKVLAAHCRARFPEAAVVSISISDQTQVEATGQWHCGRNDPRGFEACLNSLISLDCLFLVAASEGLDPDCPAGDVLPLLRLAKAVKNRLSGAEAVDCFIITVDCQRVAEAAVQPVGGGLAGLAYSLAQGDHRLRVRNLDLSREDFETPSSWPVWLDGILAESPSHRGEIVKLHSGHRYRQRLLPLVWPDECGPGFRPNGAYIILGGSGRVGGMITRELILRYQARVIWLGRRPGDDPGIRARLEAFHDLPDQPMYIQADALDLGSLRRAVETIKADHGAIHGALFAGSVFSFDNSVAETSEADFTRILDIKTKGALNFYRAVQDVPLDFFCCFSSAQAFSFSGAASLSAYAAGITFSDALARFLGGTAAFPVGMINWGFWESEQKGPAVVENAGFLDALTGMDALKRFIALLRSRVISQALCLRTTKAVRELMPIEQAQLIVAPGSLESPSSPRSAGFPACCVAGFQTCQPSGESNPLAISGIQPELNSLSTSHPGMPGACPAAGSLAEVSGADEFETWLIKLLFVQLRDLAFLTSPADAVTPSLRKWLAESRRLLEEKRALIDSSASASDLWAAWGLRKPVLRQEPSLQGQIDLAEECLRTLPRLLRGELRPTDVLFPGASMEQVERIYAENGQFAYFSRVVAESVRACLESRRAADPGFRARILEIGAGTGGTTAVVLSQLRDMEFNIEEYCYSDLSRAFLEHGKSRFSHSFLKFKALDIEQPPAPDAPGFGAYDLVIAANVLHATRDIRRTLRHAKAALKRQGRLILDEIAGPSIFAHLTFGLLPGWWLFEDASLRIPGNPGLYPSTWERLLREEGFHSIAFPAREAHRFGQQVIVAVSDGLIRMDKGGEERRTEQIAETPEPARPVIAAAAEAGGSTETVKQRMIGLLADFLKIPSSKLAHDAPFSDYGVDSILGINFIDRLGAALGLSLNSALLFDHSTINRLSAYLAKTYREQLKMGAGEITPDASPAARQAVPSALAGRELPFAAGRTEIAVIGMSGQFPGAKDTETLWRNLMEGKDAVTELPAHYLDSSNAACSTATTAQPPGGRRGGILEDRACFDPLFFNITPREAESMNPHQRLVLQESWKALEDAGLNPRSLAGQAVGLFIGAEPCGYEHESFTGASDAIIASRLSYYLDLKGPALVVNTGCSSSAAAIHLACQSLRNGETRLALAGGVFAMLNQELLGRLAAMDMLSPSGCCHSLDASADGTVFSEGVGMVALKRYDDAIADGDPIHGVIVASAMNQDGASNGITAPNGEAQEALLAGVYRRFKIDPERISYVEVHGTGTKLGDPVEANALARAFRQFTRKRHYCAMGSVKASLGHTSAAAGVISLIKLLLMMRHGKIPAMPCFQNPNPLIEFEDSAFLVNRAALDWPGSAGSPRMAAVNSFGHSGTNVHLVVRSEAVPPAAVSGSGPWIILLSARDEARLKEAAQRLAAFMGDHPVCDLSAVAYTLQVGRESMKERLALVIHQADGLPVKLKAWLEGGEAVEGCWRGTADPQHRALQLLQSDEAAQDLAARWISQGKWNKLAEFWTLGGAIDWRLLYPGTPPPRLRLPVYPFAREHYWASQGNEPVELPAAPLPANNQDQVLCFKETWERWEEVAPPAGISSENSLGTLACLLSEPSNQDAFKQTIHSLDPKARILFLRQPAALSGLDQSSLEVLLREAGPVDALLYLWPVEDRPLSKNGLVPLALLQILAALPARPKRVLLAGAVEDGLERAYLESWVGIERSLGLVLPEVQLAVLIEESSARAPLTMDTLANHAWQIISRDKLESVLYQGGLAHVLRVHPVPLRAAPALELENKTILITGGGGGLGFEAARRLARKGRVNLVLTGRSPLSPGLRDKLESLGGAAHYFQADVCDARAMELALNAARTRLGPIHGVIHAAGIKNSRTLFEKDQTAWQAVLDPKIKGSLVLDEVLARDPLEFVCYFSSSAALLGDFGACDYAMANRFQMAYAACRNGLAAEGKRNGRTHVMAWTLWSGTGMGRSMEADAAVFLKSSGQRPLRPEEGLDWLERLLAQPDAQHIVLAGREESIRRMLRCNPASAAPLRAEAAPGDKTASSLLPEKTEERLLSDLREQLSRLFKFPPARLNLTQDFADFGIDSIGLTEWASLLAKRYRIQFTPSVFFGHSTLQALAAYLVEKHAAALESFFCAESSDTQSPPVSLQPKVIHAPSGHGPSNVPEPIAIIGMSGRFPGARHVEEMWRVLQEGRCVIEEIPADRFASRALTGKSNGNDSPSGHPRAGWLPGVREFDPLFFGISPAEAEEMDPRQRLLLQEGWNALEDAGIGPLHLAKQRIGMFVGVEEGDYAPPAAGSITSNHSGILAARLAYFLDLKGPVLAINTSCSSSLVAVHQACQSLRQGECDAAVAAGANLVLDPESFAAMERAGMLSPDGVCYAFDRRANGMVPGEAVVAIVLKTLSQAEADGDPIHAVILGSGINYDGKTNGITAPSGVAQTELVRGVLEKTGIDPTQVEHIVTHGTGTRLGDPVEVNALVEAFQGASPAPASCALTSCKTNFGHTFAASGLVSVVALALSMRKQIIPASLHFRERNEFIQWENSPFYVNTANRPWPARPGRARIGAVSAFGMSGTNAHLVLRDYMAPPAPPPSRPGSYLLAWSAKSPEALGERIRRFVGIIRAGLVTDEQLPAVSETLLLGRHAFAHRQAMVVRDLAEALERLEAEKPPGAHLDRTTLGENDLSGKGYQSLTPAPSFVGGRAVESTKVVIPAGYAQPPVSSPPAEISSDDRTGRLRALAERWRQGGELDPQILDSGPSRRLHLPTYPFSQREYGLEPRCDSEVMARRSPPLPAAPPASWLSLPAATQESFQPLLQARDVEMEQKLAGLLAATLNSMGLLEDGRSLAQAAPSASIPSYLDRWLAEGKQLIRECELKQTAAPPLDALWAEWDQAKARWASHPSLQAQAVLAEHCLRALPEVLRGERQPVDVLFPDSSMELVEAVYRGHPEADLFNQVAAQAAVAWMHHQLARHPNRRFRVLEIGAGTGGTTAVVLPLLAPFREHLGEYLYTDISKAFLLHAQERFVPEYPWVAPRLFDVSRPAIEQGFAERSCDLVIAAHVLHATPDIRQAVRNAGSLLAPGGVLVLNELSANSWFTHLTFGLLEGWWLCQDRELRLRGCPAVSAETWRRLLAEEGFSAVHFPAEIAHRLGQQIILAERGETSCPAPGIHSGKENGRVDKLMESRVENASPQLPDSTTERTCPFPSDSARRQVAVTDREMRRLSVGYFKQLIGAALKMEPEEIDPAAPLESYGMDSLMIGRVLARLRELFLDVPGTLLFELQTVNDLADYFLSNRATELRKRLFPCGAGFQPAEPADPSGFQPRASDPARASLQISALERPGEAIAIVGLSGHYPFAPDLSAYWENLKSGKDCITEIPPERWSLEGFYHPEVEEAIDTGKSYCKWGGFLEGCWHFDPLFFNISPRAALETDPQERLFVQAAWEALEDAGYTRKILAERCGGRVGVFAGIAHAEFNVLGPDQWRQGKWIYPRTSFGSVANRVSFLFNLNGPSIPVDTMCSSSLTAIHMACESILRGECAMAIAGAVNLCLHPSTYVSLCASRLLSKGGKCRSFGQGEEDGYVPGEGVGALILKRLSDAERDQDRIHAVIRATAVNHGGRTNGYTVPNPQAQAGVIRQALDKAGVSARMVSYVEAHGAGTKLGDPIEVLGLTRAFRPDTAETGYCALGSVKSNVGHVEAAAGLAGLTKVILQMRHGQLVPSLHAARLNPEIKFEETPFKVQQQLATWERPVITIHGSEVTCPRIAGISAFGAGGSNAHLILEEYVEKRPASRGDGPSLIVLSARNPKRLKEAAARLSQFITENPDLTLADIAYTLQTGREAMEERAGFLAQSLPELAGRLRAFVEDKSGGCWRGSCKAAKGAAERFLDEADLSQLVSKWIQNREHGKTLDAWTRGYEVDWDRLYAAEKPRRIGLPTYPFAREKYWLEDSPTPVHSSGKEEPISPAEPPAPPQPSASSWLFFHEAWEAQEIPLSSSWPDRLAAYAGRQIAIAAADSSEASALADWLRRLEKDHRLAQPLHISILDHDPEAKIAPAPDVVLFLGPTRQASPSVEPSESDLAAVFHLSRKLMNSCWADPVAIYYLYESGDDRPRIDCEALSGFVRAAFKENEQHAWTLIGDDGRDPKLTRFQLLLKEWLSGTPRALEVRYQSGRRLVRNLAEFTLPFSSSPSFPSSFVIRHSSFHPPSCPATIDPASAVPSRHLASFRKNGVYWLAGGMGCLGKLLSLELARRYQATLVLLTRGELDDSRLAHFRALKDLGAKVICRSVDVADRPRLEAVYQEIVPQTGPIHGLFHLARHHEDQIIARKPWASFCRVIRPKVHGLLHLDELTRNEPLDFFAVFSSLGAYGVRGSSDYSYSTAYQNAFASLRNRWVREGRRSGATVSLCWGPWIEDHLFPESRARLVEAGFGLIDMEAGFPALEAALAGGVSPLGIVRVRDGDAIRSLLGLHPSPEPSAGARPADRLEPLLADWEHRQSRGEDVSGIIAQRITPSELDKLPDALVARVYRLLLGANGDGNFTDINPSKDGPLGHASQRPDRGGDGSSPQESSPAALCGDESSPPLSQSPMLQLSPDRPAPEVKPALKGDAQSVAGIVRATMAEVLHLSEIDDERSFMDYGLDSIAGMLLSVRLEKRLKREVPPQSLINFPTVAALTQHLLL